MDTTNETYTTNDQSPAQVEQTINAMVRLITDDPFELPEALLLGISYLDGISVNFIASGDNVYALLGDPRHKLEASVFEAAAVVTCGWATPFDSSESLSDAAEPWNRPERTRVCVTLIAGGDNICSAIRFANNPDDVIINNGYYGPAGDALSDFWTR